MADFSIISDVSNEVLKLLRENICPELIQSPDQTPPQSGPVSAEASDSVFRIVPEYQIPDDG